MSSHKGTLFLIPTPIGNLEDMTYRAVRTLQEVDVVAAEDTRHTGVLLQHFNIAKPMISYHEHNKAEKGTDLIQRLLDGQSIGLVSDAGMPAISDPGEDLVKEAIDAGIPIVPLPGANAGLTALIASGQNTKEFHFIGFLPKRKQNVKDMLSRIATYEGTLIFYEAPHRIEETIQSLYEGLGNRSITVGRELTKKFETFTRTTLFELQNDFSQIIEKGEFVLLVGGSETVTDETMVEEVLLSPLEAALALIKEGMPKKEAARQIAKERGLSRRDVYNEIEWYSKERTDD
ncbi:16S rRNA (cytidine(1402)-2'-O)-methyltransferase [Veillonella sp. VA142]|uniref:16S rRNA (cytidine(1402)-2'-O)-methyltransferase n=1 Tax=Veillonella sp. VA142 TaxID=741834 RepID=UPI000F8E58AB|nr:16S rRNA (cytidine(1402)-2'-O)-methyltransferase [Veillonella sp. VA142]